MLFRKSLEQHSRNQGAEYESAFPTLFRFGTQPQIRLRVRSTIEKRDPGRFDIFYHQEFPPENSRKPIDFSRAIEKYSVQIEDISEKTTKCSIQPNDIED